MIKRFFHNDNKNSFSRLEAYLAEFVYGGIDGCVTTFAVVAGSVGAGLDSVVIIILGFANLFADGFAMSVGAYLSTKSKRDNYQKYKKKEIEGISKRSEEKRERIRVIYRKKGFSGALLEQVVSVVTGDHNRWAESLMNEEYGMAQDDKTPFAIGLVTYLSFITIGLIPLLVYVMDYIYKLGTNLFLIATILTGIGFIIIGSLRAIVNETSIFKGIIQTLALGAIAAVVAFYVGYALEQLLLPG